MKPVHIDGLLYVCVAVFAALAASFGSDEATKYVSPANLFYLRSLFGAASAGALALKMYRSTSYAYHRDSVDSAVNIEEKPNQTA